jgi:hypothetical protein
MSVTRSQIVAAARRYAGVPFVHQGRTEWGLDCAGLWIRVAHDLGVTDFDFTNYLREPDGETFDRLMAEHCRRVPVAEAREGDAILMTYAQAPQHLAVITEVYGPDSFRIIHARAERKVEEHDCGGRWMRAYNARLLRAYSMPGVTDG